MKDEIRKGMSQAQLNETGSTFLIGQIFITAIALGLWSGSWVVFGASFISLFAFSMIKALGTIIAIASGIGVGILTGYLAGLFFGTAAMIVVGIIGALVGLGLNLSGIEWLRDITDK